VNKNQAWFFSCFRFYVKTPSDMSETFVPFARQWQENLGENPSYSSLKTLGRFRIDKE
jgi:hypothetical protein